MNSVAPEELPVTTNVSTDSRFQAAQSVWDHIASQPPFARLIHAKRAFIVPAFIVYAIFCLLMPVLNGLAPGWMASKLGGMSMAYLYGMFLILLSWAIVWLYVGAASRFDAMARQIVEDAASTDAKGEPRAGEGSN